MPPAGYDESLILHRPLRVRVGYFLFERMVRNFANIIIVYSEWQKKRLKFNGKIHVIYPGVDHIQILGVNFLEKVNHAVCITGPLSSSERVMRKGIDILLQIAKKPEIIFHIVGATYTQRTCS